MTTKVKFTLPLASIIGTTECILLGEFNNWNPAEGIVMKVDKDGSLYAEVELPAGQEFQYRYLLGNGSWVNDNADKVVAEAYGYPVENCVVRIPEAIKIPAQKKTCTHSGSDKDSRSEKNESDETESSGKAQGACGER